MGAAAEERASHAPGGTARHRPQLPPPVRVAEHLVLRLVPKKKQKKKGVKWAEGVVDNEDMNKRKSNSACFCCCRLRVVTQAVALLTPRSGALLQSAAFSTSSEYLGTGVMMTATMTWSVLTAAIAWRMERPRTLWTCHKTRDFGGPRDFGAPVCPPLFSVP